MPVHNLTRAVIRWRMLFRRKRRFPLSDLCSTYSPAFIAEHVEAGDSTDEYKHARLLQYLVMHGAAVFINNDLNPKVNDVWSWSPSILTDKNKDVITAETILWLCFLMERFWIADNDHERRERVGAFTLYAADKLCVHTVSRVTRVNFRDRALDGRRHYLNAERDTGDTMGAFIGRLLASADNRTLADRPKTAYLADTSRTPFRTQICLSAAVSSFFPAVPNAIYETFTKSLRE